MITCGRQIGRLHSSTPELAYNQPSALTNGLACTRFLATAPRRVCVGTRYHSRRASKHCKQTIRPKKKKQTIRANVYPRNATGRNWFCIDQSQTADFLQRTTMFLRSSTRERDSQLRFCLSFQISGEYWNNRSASWACDSATTTPAKLGISPLKTAGALPRRPHDRAN